MKELKKQDRTRSRLPVDTERKYKLGEIELTKEELEQLKSELVVDEHLSATSSNAVQNKAITQALNSKVSKVDGKDLSTNDFTNEDKEALDSMTENNHNHDNKEALDTITSDKIDEWDKATQDRHKHENITYLDKITEDIVLNIHGHDNKDVLDTITQEEIAKWNGKANILDAYPIGSIYIRADETDPSTILGGMWEAVTDTTLTGLYIWKRIEEEVEE